MKYKLLKDTAGARKGDVLEDTHPLIQALIYMHEGNKAELEKWIEKIYGRVYYITYNGEIGHIYLPALIDSVAAGMIKLGNVFKTKEEAVKMRDFLKAWNTLKNSSDFEPDWENTEQRKWYVYNNRVNNRLGTISTRLTSEIAPCHYKTNKEADEALEKYKKEWEIVLGVEK